MDVRENGLLGLVVENPNAYQGIVREKAQCPGGSYQKARLINGKEVEVFYQCYLPDGHSGYCNWTLLVSPRE